MLFSCILIFHCDYRGTHSRDHLSSVIADHYKLEDADFHNRAA